MLLIVIIFMISSIALPKYRTEAGNAWGSELYLSMHCRHVSNARKGEVVRCDLKITFGQNYRSWLNAELSCSAILMFVPCCFLGTRLIKECR